MAVSGPDALFATKLGIPARGTRFVVRERLRRLLDSATEARLVLVSAPAGFGKSTVLADWLAGAQVRHAWLSLDPGDNDVVRFYRYLATAAGQLADRPGGEPAFDSAGPFDPELALAGVVGDLAAAVGSGDGRGVVLVLDDYHLIEEPAIHRLVASLVERLPAGARLAMATRADPPLQLARLRAGGELLEVRAEDLRFTSAEAAELLRSAGADLATSEVDELTTRTEGWAAALRLAALSLRGRSNHAQVVRQFGASHRYILDYVVEEVLASLPPETQQFLLRTSILDRLSGALCEAVTGTADGQAQLEELERANLLIVPLDDERRWYRYHALFAEILRARLTLQHPDEVATLHARASSWHEDQGDDDEAISHALRSGDAERLSRIVAFASGRHMNAGELSTVRRWLDAVPPDLVRNHAQLSASYAWCLVLVGEVAGVAGRLADADRALAAGRDGGPMMRLAIATQLAMLRSQLAGLEGDNATAIDQARLARELVPAQIPAEGAAILRGTAAALLAVALFRAGDLEAASSTYEEALPDLRAGGNRFAAGRAVADIARVAIARGEPRRAVQICELELEPIQDGVAAAPSAPVWAALARAHLELGDAERAVVAARRALELASRAGDAPVAHAAEAIIESAQQVLAHQAEAAHQAVGAHQAGAAGAQAAHPAGPAHRGTGNGDRPVELLTGREIEVLALVALGRSNQQIARELFVTVGTVKAHLHTISGKLDAANRVEAVARGRERGILG